MGDNEEPSGWYLQRYYHDQFKRIDIPRYGELEISSNRDKSCIPLNSLLYRFVSYKHFVIKTYGGRPFLIDEYSVWGTYLNHLKLSMWEPGICCLQEGVLIGIGSNPMIYHKRYYEYSPHILVYRLCKILSPEAVIAIDDDEE